MAAGLPVVAARAEGTSELVIDGQTGWLVTSREPQILAAALDALLNDPTGAATMGRAGRERATAQFSWDKMVAHYDALYRSHLPVFPPLPVK